MQMDLIGLDVISQPENVKKLFNPQLLCMTLKNENKHFTQTCQIVRVSLKRIFQLIDTLPINYSIIGFRPNQLILPINCN